MIREKVPMLTSRAYRAILRAMNTTTFFTRASIAALAIVLMAAIAGGAVLAQAASVKASVQYLDGNVKINGKPAEIGQALGAKFSVETGPGSACDVVFGGRNSFRVSQNAFVTVDFSKRAPEFELRKGGLTSVLKKLDAIAGQDSYRVRTPTAIAGVRGTSFCIWADETSTYVCACNGTVRTLDAKGGHELGLTAAHHTARIYSVANGTTSVAEAGVLHHDDALVQAVANEIGYTVDWTVAD